MALNTSIRGLQIKDAFFGDGLKRNAGDGDIAEVALKTNGGLKIDTAELTVEPTDFAGTGLEDDGADSLRLASQGNGITGGAGSVLSVQADATGGANLATVIDVNSNGVAVGIDDSTVGENASNQLEVKDDAIDQSKLSATDPGAGEDGYVLTYDHGTTSLTWTTKTSVTEDYLQESEIKLEDESATCDGVTTDFTLDSSPVANSVQVYLNGLLQQEGSGEDYTLSGTTVSFATAPDTGDILILHYIAT